jgi:hypothetical protein
MRELHYSTETLAGHQSLCIDEPNSLGLSLHQTEKSAKTRADKLTWEDLEQLENGTHVIEIVPATIEN